MSREPGPAPEPEVLNTSLEEQTLEANNMAQNERDNIKQMFVGCRVTGDAQDDLEDTSQRIGRLMPQAAQWEPENEFQITLRSLGEMDLSKGFDKAKIQGMELGLNIIARTFPKIRVEVGEVGRFPGVVWAGVNGSAQAIQELYLIANRIDHLAQGLGWQKPDQPFAPHIPLGRYIRQHEEIPDSDLDEQGLAHMPDLEMISTRGTTWIVRELELMFSVQTWDGLTPRVQYLTYGSPHGLGLTING